MAEFEFTQREIPYGQNPNYSDGKDLDTSKFRPGDKNSDDELRRLLQKSNMSKSVDDGVTTNKVNTGIKDMNIGEFSTKFAADLKYKKIQGGINQIGDFSTEGNLSDGGVENLNTETLSDGSFFDSFGKAFGRTAITSIPGFNAVADIVNTFWEREPAGLNKAIIGIDGLKEREANKKEIPGPGFNRLNNNENFPLGTIESNKFGALYSDRTVGFLNSLKSTEGGAKNVLKNIGLEAASNALGILNSVSGINIGDEIAFWDPEQNTDDLTAQELVALQSVSTQNIYDEKPGKVIYPTLPNQMKDEEGNHRTNKKWLKERLSGDSIGHIYVEPYFNREGLKVFSIPFQFNPEISEGSLTAEYAIEKILGRITAARYYISTDSGTTTIKTKYIATNLKNNDPKNYSDLDSEWYNYWTAEKIKEIEWKYRSLVFPTRDSGYLVKPPIVQLYINNYAGGGTMKTIGNVLSYPIKHEGESSGTTTLNRADSYVTYGGKPVFEHTKSFLESATHLSGGEGAVKRFIVTDVKIEDVENTNGWNYDKINGYKRGFTVTITLAETTRNFLDQVPDFKSYYEAFNRSSEIHDVGLGAAGAEQKMFDMDIVRQAKEKQEKEIAEKISDGAFWDMLNLPKLKETTDESSVSLLKQTGGDNQSIVANMVSKENMNSKMFMHEPPQTVSFGISFGNNSSLGIIG